MTPRGLSKPQWLMVAFTLAAFALRVYQLDNQSLWSDEGLSLYRARLSLSENLSNIIVVPPNVPTRDTNPPLYFMALSGWRAVAGESEYALRFLSVAAGLLIVPLLYVAGRRLFSTSAGLLAAALGVLSPFLIWYSQEARMYTWLAALSLASVHALLRAVDPTADRPVARWMAWVLITAAAIYTHFTAFFLLPFESVLILRALWRVRRRWALAAVALLIGLSVPIGLYAWSRAPGGAEPSIQFRPLNSIVEEMSSTLAVGRSNETFQPVWLVAPTLVLLGVGALGGLLTQRRGTQITLLYLLMPLLVFYTATFVQPLYSGPRHLMLIAPPFYLLAGSGAAQLWQRWRVIGALLMVIVLGVMVYWLSVQFADPAYRKDDMRSAARVISERATTDDVVIVHDAISSFVFDYYYTGAAPWVIIPEYPSVDAERAVEQFLAQAQAAQRVWFVTKPAPLGAFPNNVVDEWARGHLLRLDHQTFPSIWLGAAYQLYTAHFPILDALPSTAQSRTAAWPALNLQLVGVEPITLAAAHHTARVTLYWQLDQPAPFNAVFTLRLVDATGAEWGLLINTAFDNWSAKQWPVGKLIKHTATLELPHGLPGGQYYLRLSITSKQTSELLTEAAGRSEIEAATIEVAP